MATKQNNTQKAHDYVSTVHDYIVLVMKNLEKIEKEIRDIHLYSTNQQHKKLIIDTYPRISRRKSREL